MNSEQKTGGKFTVGLPVLMLMALALIASELRSGGDAGLNHTATPDRILFIEAGKG